MPRATPLVPATPPLEPYWTTTDGQHVRLYHGNVTEVLARLPAKSVHMCVTSPPYWGLRDYKAGETEIGREKTPDEFVSTMVDVFRGVRRVLRDDGTVWLNLGDSYDGNGLVSIPWRVAITLQADGWVLRQDIIWHKPAPMPESVRNRCTKAHEYVFLLAKSAKYFYDAEAIKEKTSDRSKGQRTTKGYDTADRYGANNGGNGGLDGMADRLNSGEVTSSNKRSVWTISSQGYEGAHFATFPPKLIEPMIKAGTSEKGCCGSCGAPWKRVVEENKRPTGSAVGGTKYVEMDHLPQSGNEYQEKVTKTVGWEPTCECGAEVVPCTVLDCFIGSGTTCAVSIDLGRRSVGIDLSEKYLKNNAVPRIEGVLLSRPALAKLVKRKKVEMKWSSVVFIK